MEQTYTQAMEALRQEFAHCADLYLQEVTVGECRMGVVCFKGLADRTVVSDTILRPMLDTLRSGGFDGNFGGVLRNGTFLSPEDLSVVSAGVLRGDVFLAVETQGGTFFCLANAFAGVSRTVSPPETDVTVRGPMLGFVEDTDKGMVMLRQYLRTGDLKFVTLFLGNTTHTRITVAYLQSRADMTFVENLKTKLASLQAETVMDSGYLELLLQGGRTPLFPMMGSTEKVDKVASKLLAGRVALLVDGSPFVLTAPYVLAESLQSPEDYLQTPYYATAVRCLRVLALCIAVLLPGILVAFGEFHPELMPRAILDNLHKSREGLPFSLFWECAVSLLIFELVREVGVRMPRTVGDAVGIVASIILGDAAVEAKLASTPVIMTVALSAVCAFIVPAFMYATVLLRFVFLVSAGLFGLGGMTLTAAVVLCLLAAKESFGVPYLSPLSPIRRKGLQDFLLTIPKKTLGRREEL